MDLFRRFSARRASTPDAKNGAETAQTIQLHQPTQPAPAKNGRFRPLKFRFSPFSGNTISQGLWSAQDFMLGVGMVIIQPETERVVLCYDPRRKQYFFPKGRKDAWEPMETAVLREAYEESGFRATFLPLYVPSNAPIPPADRDNSLANVPVKSTEPFFVLTKTYNPRPRKNSFTKQNNDTSRVYFIHWYVGQIPPDAVREEGTGMPDELLYTSHLLQYEEALEKLDGDLQRILQYAWFLFQETAHHDKTVAESFAALSSN